MKSKQPSPEKQVNRGGTLSAIRAGALDKFHEWVAETSSLEWRLRSYKVPEPIVQSAAVAENAGCSVSVSTIDRDHHHGTPTSRHACVVAHGPASEIERLFVAGWSVWRHPSGLLGPEAWWEAPFAIPAGYPPNKSPSDPATFPIDSAEYRGEQGAAPPEPPRTDPEEPLQSEIARFQVDPDLQSAVKYDSGFAAGKFRPLQPVYLSQSRFRELMTAELRALQQWKLADRVDDCGKSAYTTSCPDCGADPAKVVLFTGCDARVCVWCARRTAMEQARLIDEAVTNFDLDLLPKTNARIAKLETQREKLREKKAVAQQRIKQLEQRISEGDASSIAARENAKGRVYSLSRKIGSLGARISQLRQAHRDLKRNKHRRSDQSKNGGWSWKWLTIGLKWDIFDPTNYTLAGIKRRFRELDGYQRTLCKMLAFETVAGAVASFEISEGGHIHAHVLYRGPVVNFKWLNQATFGPDWSETDPNRVGTVKLGEVTDRAKDQFPEELLDANGNDKGMRAAIRETVKYTVKAPTPLRVEWIAGEKAKTIHPKLAARWQVGTAKRQLRRYYGGFRDALFQASAARKPDPLKPQKDPTFHCVECGVELPAVDVNQGWSHAWTDAVARRVLNGEAETAPGPLARMNARQRWRELLSIKKKPSTFAPQRKTYSTPADHCAWLNAQD